MPLPVKYYAIYNYSNLNYEELSLHIKEFNSIQKALDFHLTDLIITQKQLKNEHSSGAVPYQYEIQDKNLNPYYFTCGEIKLTDNIFRTVGGYCGDYAKIQIKDKNNKLNIIDVESTGGYHLGLIINLLQMLKLLKEDFNSDGKFYKETEKLKSRINELERELQIANNKIKKYQENINN